MDMIKTTLLNDPTLWLVFSFVAFVVLAFLFGRKSVLSMLDSKIEKIRHDISAAEKLQTEAETLLNQYKSNLQNASVEADRIIAKAKLQAEEIRNQSELNFAETLSRRETMLKTRIDQMERAAIDDIRRYAAELAVSATSEIIAQKLSEQKASALADASIRNISDKLN
jgi:F-type H+-transporting ATPase subunit b